MRKNGHRQRTQEINRKWWDYMEDVMDTNPDNSPVAVDLEQVFEL